MQSQNATAYQGLAFLKNFKLYKLIDDIEVDGFQKTQEFKTNKIKLITSNGTIEAVFLKPDQLSLKSIDYKGKLNISLDSREINDYDDQGRIYTPQQKSNTEVRINYSKYETNELKNKKYELNYSIKSSKTITYKDNWNETNYSYDKERGDNGHHYINKAIQTQLQDKDTLTITFNDYTQSKETKKKLKKVLSSKTELQTLNSLYLPKENAILAGLPWFYQIWARDELISLAPLILQKEKNKLKQIINRQLERIGTDGLVKNRYPESELGSIDSLGLLALRINQSIEIIKPSKRELQNIYLIIKKAMTTLEANRLSNSLIKNAPLETWMDTGSGNSQRSGYRIEIQTLHLTIYDLLNKIETKLALQKTKSKDIQAAFESNFIQQDKLIDGLEEDLTIDPIARPNIFLAHYINGQIINPKIWENTFDEVIEKCWLEWGGFSSIDKSNQKFESNHTGMNNRSYHHGDSWFFINNMAAISMAKVNYQKYEYYIKKILEASLKDMNQNGLKGHCSEISSAAQLSSKGSWCQAWSSSTLHELIILLENLGIKELNN